jgi:hypothetical protein
MDSCYWDSRAFSFFIVVYYTTVNTHISPILLVIIFWDISSRELLHRKLSQMF